MVKKDKRRKITPEMIRRMKKLREEGLSYTRIATKLNVAPMTVYNYLKTGKKIGFFEKLKRKFR